MKDILLKNLNRSIVRFFGAFLFFLILAGCSNDDDATGGEITVNAVFLQDVNSTVPDRQVEFVRLGQLLRIEGSGFAGLKRVFINGYETGFNPVYVSDTSMLIRVSGDTPTVEAADEVRNT
ncbi:MAG: hypothetical protein NWQ06_03610, partial [Leeuwenhoekiella sp.]|nr:hypothetical protein [Leeuwenhoekiella sp.]